MDPGEEQDKIIENWSDLCLFFSLFPGTLVCGVHGVSGRAVRGLRTLENHVGRKRLSPLSLTEGGRKGGSFTWQFPTETITNSTAGGQEVRFIWCPLTWANLGKEMTHQSETICSPLKIPSMGETDFSAGGTETRWHNRPSSVSWGDVTSAAGWGHTYTHACLRCVCVCVFTAKDASVGVYERKSLNYLYNSLYEYFKNQYKNVSNFDLINHLVHNEL